MSSDNKTHLPPELFMEYSRLDIMWQALVRERDEAKLALQKEKNFVKYLLGEAVMVLADREELSLTEVFADALRDNLLEDLWYHKLTEEQLKSLRRNVPARLAIAFFEMDELNKKLEKLTKEFEEYKKTHG